MTNFILRLNPVLSRNPVVRPRVIGCVGLALFVISASTHGVFGKQITGGFTPLSLMFISEAMGGIFVVMSFGVVPLIKQVASLSKQQLISLLNVGVLSGIIAPLLWFKGLVGSSAINAELFSRTEMFFLVLLSAVILRERINRYQVLSLVVIAMGVICISLQGLTVGFAFSSGDLLVMASAVAFACGGLIMKKDLQHTSPQLIIMSRALAASLVFFAVSPFLETNLAAELKNAPAAMISALLCYGFIVRFMGAYSFHEALEHLSVSTISVYSTLSIIGGIIFANLYLGEEIHWYQVVGAAFIIAGVLISKKSGFHWNRLWHTYSRSQNRR